MMLAQISKHREELMDCLNCSAARRLCDRSRYRCDTCAQNSDDCQGYPRQLQWLVGITSRGKDKHKSLSIKSSNPKWQPVRHSKHSFKFKPGIPRSGRAALSKPPTAVPETCSPSFEARGLPSQTPQPAAHPELLPGSADLPLDDASGFFGDGLESILVTCTATYSNSNNEDKDLEAPESLQLDDSLLRHRHTPEEDCDIDHDNDNTEKSDDRPEDITVITPCDAILSSSYSKQPAGPAPETVQLLTFYDLHLCTVPFTHDFPENPLRCTQGASSVSTHLLHALLAFSLQHVSRLGDRSPADNHSFADQITAYKYSAAASCEKTSPCMSEIAKMHLLDTIVILFALDTLVSACGPWRARLTNLYLRIEAMNGLEFIATSSRAHAQLMLFVWWDCSTALVARATPVFPRGYYDYVLEHDTGATYDIFTISGVPRDLFRCFRELAQMAGEKRLVATLQHATFNVGRALEIDSNIRAYNIGDHLAVHPPDSTDEDAAAELLECWHDYYNAANAWKHALLLYIARVFRWDPSCPKSLSELTSLSRIVLDSVRCCRPESTMQKQLLFPVFVAGAEARDAYSRDFVRLYCDSWYQQSRYTLFHEASMLLQEIWTQKDLSTNNSVVWWGSIIDSKQANGGEFLFG